MGHNIMAMVTLGAYAEWIFVLNEERNMLDYCLKETADDNTINNLQKLNTNNSLTKSSSMESDRAWLQQSTIKEINLNAQVVIQCPGDLVIVPIRAYHQVRKVGISVKIAWIELHPKH